MSKLGLQKGAARDRYLELVHEFPLVSIRTNKELRAAHKVIDSLLANGPQGEGEEIYLDALSDLASVYEEENIELPKAIDADLLTHLFEAKGVSQAEAANKLRISKSTVSELLSGRRKLTRAQVTRFANYFNVEPSAFMPASRD